MVLDIPWWFYAIAFVIGLIIWKCWRWEGGFLVGYAFLVLFETLLVRRVHGGSHFQPELFWSWRAWDKQRNQILTNVIMFIPVGVFTGLMWRWKGLWVAFGFSVVIEVLQLITARGLMEFDDVFHNATGAAVGIGIVMLIKMLKTGAIENDTKA